MQDLASSTPNGTLPTAFPTLSLSHYGQLESQLFEGLLPASQVESPCQRSKSILPWNFHANVWFETYKSLEYIAMYIYNTHCLQLLLEVFPKRTDIKPILAQKNLHWCTMPPQWSAPHRIVPIEELAAHGLSGDGNCCSWWSWQYTGVSKNRGTPLKWMIWGYPYF